jgi:hypothetical protein
MSAVQFSDLVGKTISSIDGLEGDDLITLKTTEGEVYQMYHSQDCCEQVRIEEIHGDIEDIIGLPDDVDQTVTPDKIRLAGVLFIFFVVLILAFFAFFK